MRIEQLREFVVFSQTLNISETARKLNTTQSSMSKRILELEKELKVSLVNHGFKMSLTPAGQLFVRDMVNLLKSFDETVEKCKAIQAEQVTEIRLQETGFYSEGMKVLFTFAREYHDIHPNTTINAHLMVRQTPVEALDGNRFDIVLQYAPGTGEEFEEFYAGGKYRVVRVITEDLSIWMRKDHPLASKETITLEDISGVPIFSNTGVHYNFMDEVIEKILTSHGLTARFHTVNSTGSQKESLLIRNFHDSVLVIHRDSAHDSLMLSRDDMVVRQIDDPRAKTTLFLMASANNRKAGVQEFLDFVEGVSSEDGQSE